MYDIEVEGRKLAASHVQHPLVAISCHHQDRIVEDELNEDVPKAFIWPALLDREHCALSDKPMQRRRNVRCRRRHRVVERFTHPSRLPDLNAGGNPPMTSEADQNVPPRALPSGPISARLRRYWGSVSPRRAGRF